MIEIYYRWSELDKKHEYGIIAPYNLLEVYLTYWTYWFWYYIGAETKGKHRNPTIIPFANTWDKETKLIKTYIDLRDSETCAKRAVKFINKHYNKKIGFK